MKKGIIGAVLIAGALRLAVLAGAGEAVKKWGAELGPGGKLSASFSLELGQDPQNEAEVSEPPQAELRTVLLPVTQEPEADGSAEDEEAVQEPEIIETNLSAEVSLRNDTGFDVDLEALAQEGLELRLKKGEPQILIFHTHSSEAYTQDEFDRYEESDESRTEDKKYNIIRVGDELTEKLEACGLTVIHDREIYDYPSYTGSYTRSGAAVEEYLSQYPSIQIVIDLHRDAIGSGDVVYKTKAELSGKSCAQVMLLIGTGENGLYHPYWRENLKLALYMQNAMDSLYPSLARPIALKPERYNQHLTKGSMIIEVGSSGNTLSEALLAIDLFGESVGPALAELIQ